MSVPSPVASGSSASSVSSRQPDPGADVENADRPLAPTLARSNAERRLDQRFAIGPRVERRRRQREAAAVEFPLAENARHGLARAASRQHRLQLRPALAGKRLLGAGDDLRRVDARRGGDKQARIAPGILDPASRQARWAARTASPSVAPSPRAAGASGIFHVRQ